jgi:molybdopterin-guanine dinucleotide biosynthesis protein A
VPDISAVVLAGGRSRRLGMDKSLLRVNGRWLLEQILGAVSALSDDLILVGTSRRQFARLPARVVPDDFPGGGPLAGIYSGVKAMRHQRGLFLACDMPFLNLHLLRYMVLLSSDFDVVIPSIEVKTEPLHAIYSQACADPIRASLERKDQRVVSFFPQVRVRYVSPSEIDLLDPEHLSFFNINTAEDLARAETLLRLDGKRSP